METTFFALSIISLFLSVLFLYLDSVHETGQGYTWRFKVADGFTWAAIFFGVMWAVIFVQRCGGCN